MTDEIMGISYIREDNGQRSEVLAFPELDLFFIRPVDGNYRDQRVNGHNWHITSLMGDEARKVFEGKFPEYEHIYIGDRPLIGKLMKVKASKLLLLRLMAKIDQKTSLEENIREEIEHIEKV